MTKLLDSMYIGAKLRFENFLEELRSNETGVSSIVATILLILIVVLLVGVFWDRLQEWLNGIMDTIFNTEITTE